MFQNLKNFSFYNALRSFCPYSVIAILYFEEITGSYAVAMSIFAFSSLAASILEIPTGIFSDLIGRRKTIILGAFAQLGSILSYCSAGLISEYSLFFLFGGAILNGLANALFSGTDEALLYDSLKTLNLEKAFGSYYGKSLSYGQFMIGTSAIIGSVIAYYSSYLVVYEFSIIAGVALILCTMLFKEPPAAPCETKSVSMWSHMSEALKHFKNKPRLRYLAIARTIDHSTGMINMRFESAYFALLIPTYLLGVPRVIKQILGTISFWMAGSLIKKHKAMRVLIYSEYGRTIPRLVGLLMNNFWSPFVMMLSNAAFGTSITAIKSVLQKQYSSSQRATMSSIIAMFGNLLFAVLSILIGWLADITSVQTALIIFISFRLIILYIYIHLAKHKN